MKYTITGMLLLLMLIGYGIYFHCFTKVTIYQDTSKSDSPIYQIELGLRFPWQPFLQNIFTDEQGNEIINLDPIIKELMDNPEGGKIVLPDGTYSAPSIYGEDGIIRWGNPN